MHSRSTAPGPAARCAGPPSAANAVACPSAPCARPSPARRTGGEETHSQWPRAIVLGPGCRERDCGAWEDSSMKVGVQVGQVVPGGHDLQRQWQEQLEHFRACRDAGFDFITWGHHWLIHPFQHFQPIPVLARRAAEAGEMDLVTGVLLTPLLNPVQVAEDTATLDHISRGHLIFGVGLGYRPEEFEAAGSAMSERVPRFEEGLALMKRLWTEAEVTHHGRFYRITGGRPTARPYQRPHPRLWVAGMTEPAIRRAGRLGHPFYAIGTLTVDQLEQGLAAWRAALAEAGHPVPSMASWRSRSSSARPANVWRSSPASAI